jgi:hypothetical protein
MERKCVSAYYGETLAEEEELIVRYVFQYLVQVHH